MAKGPGDGGAKEIRILARGTEKGPPASPHQRQPSSKITSDSESSVRSCRLPCSPTRFLGPRYECHRVRFLQAERGPESGPNPLPLPAAPHHSVGCLRQRRINDHAGLRQHATGTRSRLIASHESKEKPPIDWSRIQDRLSLRVLLIYWLIWKRSICPGGGDLMDG